MEDLTIKDKLGLLLENILTISPKFSRFFVKVFNIRFSHRNKIYLSKYWKAKENNDNISSLPKIDGLIRKIQLANLVILREFDYICNEAGINYWLYFGTMLGAKRHNGYIPWDDDIDVGMLRDDYEKFKNIFNTYVRNKDLYLTIIKNKHTPCMLIMKIKHKRLPFLFIDIFPFDFYYKSLSNDEQTELNTKIIDIRNKINNNKSLLKLSIENIYDYAINVKNNEVLENNSINPQDKPDIFMGLDFPHDSQRRIYSYNDVFPTHNVNFEGLVFKQVNNPEVHLEGTFGKNYMDYPPTIALGHCINQVVTKKELKIMDELIKTL